VLRSITVPALAVGLLVTGSMSSAAAQDAEPTLDEIREMVLYARYREAIDAAQQYTERAGLSARELNAALEILATAQLATRSSSANETLSRLYMRDPGHILSDPGAGPTVQAAFQRAREETTEHVTPELVHTPAQLERRTAPVIEVQLAQHADAVDDVRVSYRGEGEARYTTVTMDVDEQGVARARLPLAEGEAAYVLEYRIEAAAPSGAVLSRLGDEGAPLTLTVPEAPAGAAAFMAGGGAGTRPPDDTADDEGGGVLSQWWFWTVVVLVVGGGVAAGIILSQDDEPTMQGSLGTFTLGE
jgi:hypothetical protein